MKLQEVKGQFTITLPNNIVKCFGWSKGDKLYFKIIDLGRFEISKNIK